MPVFLENSYNFDVILLDVRYWITPHDTDNVVSTRSVQDLNGDDSELRLGFCEKNIIFTHEYTFSLISGVQITNEMFNIGIRETSIGISDLVHRILLNWKYGLVLQKFEY